MQLLASTSPAMLPAPGGPTRFPANTTNSRPRNPVTAVQSRAVHSSSPNSAKFVAVAQYCSGGFSKYLRPLSLGVIQSPEASISREISA